MENSPGNSYNLSIRISSDGFSLSVHDESGLLLSRKKVTASLFSLPADEIIDIMDLETRLNYGKIRLICESDMYVFVPASIFKSEEAIDLLSFQHKIAKTDRIVYNIIPTWDTINIFAIPFSLKDALTRLFPGTTIEHHQSWFLTEKILPQQDNSISVWIRPKILDTIALKNGKLQLLNSFSYETPEDFSYHTLNIVELLSLDMEKCKVFLYNTERKTEIEKILEKYITVING